MRTATALVVLLLAVAAPATPPEHAAARPGSVRGRVELAADGVRLADVGPVVVYLDAPAGEVEYAPPREVPKISQRNARFSPSFLVVARGQTVEMPNDDTIVHNVFSYSKPNELDLGLYPKGASRLVTLRHAGVVRVYCSIHESMNATIFVAPSPYHTLAGPSGDFEIRGVPRGAYRLHTWSQMLPEAIRDVHVADGGATRVEIAIEGATGVR
jgi:plastocyanin